MSSLQEFSDCRRSGKSPEKSNFAQTCNRLSQFLKEKRSLGGDLGLGIAGKLDVKGRPETTRNTVVFGSMEKPGETTWAAQHGLMDLFPQHAGVGCPTTTESDVPNKAISSIETEPKTAPMTIFYGGQVLVFDNFPADKAGELMLIAAGKESCPNPSIFLPTAGAENQIKSGDSAASGSHTHDHHLQSQPQARRASLHRFFEKRKDRVTARAPYQVHGTSSAKHEEHLALKL